MTPAIQTELAADVVPGYSPALHENEVSVLFNRRNCPPQAQTPARVDEAERFKRNNQDATPLNLENQNQPPVNVAPMPVDDGPPTWLVVLLVVLGTVAVVVCFVLGVLSQWRKIHRSA